MKKKLLFLSVIGVMTFAAAAMAASPVVKVRVVNVTAYGQDQLQDDAGVVSAATISTAEDPQLYPTIESLVFTVGKDNVSYAPDAAVPAGSLKLSGSVGETEPFEFISIPYPDRVGKFDLAIVGRDGKISYIDEPVVIDYDLRTITTVKPLAVKDGDVVLIFVKEAPLMPPEKRYDALEHYEYQPPTFDPTHGPNEDGGGGPGGGGGQGGPG
jgi:hypothetical protein